jgi:hypothetical protein
LQERCLRRPLRLSYFFFFPGNTLATALAIDPATFATTPFFEPRFFAFGFVVFDLDLVERAFGADFDFVFFFAAVFAITDPPTFPSLQIILVSLPSPFEIGRSAPAAP